MSTPSGPNPAGPSATGPTDLGSHETTIALLGIVAVVVLALFGMWFYGTGGEVSTVAVLGASLGTVGSIVGAVVGVGMGSKSGSATGAAAKQAADAQTKLTKSASKRVQTALNSILTPGGGPPPAGGAPRTLVAGVHSSQVEDALKQIDEALDDLQ